MRLRPSQLMRLIPPGVTFLIPDEAWIKVDGFIECDIDVWLADPHSKQKKKILYKKHRNKKFGIK